MDMLGEDGQEPIQADHAEHHAVEAAPQAPGQVGNGAAQNPPDAAQAAAPVIDVER